MSDMSPGQIETNGRSGDISQTPRETAERRLRESLAILDAIEMGDLLSALPLEINDRKRHATAVWLLEVLHDRLERVIGDLRHLGEPE